MNQKAFVVPVRDLDDGPKTLRQPLTDAWLAAQLADTDVQPAGTGDGQVDVTFTKSGREVLVRGRLTATVQVPCARTLDPAVYRLRPEIFLLLAPGPEGPDARRGHEKAGSGSGKTTSAKKDRPSAGRSGWEADPLLEQEDAARDTYTGDQVVLDDFLREFILLEIPMVPLREDLRDAPFEATPPPPAGPGRVAPNTDPRLAPLAALKARLEKKE